MPSDPNPKFCTVSKLRDQDRVDLRTSSFSMGATLRTGATFLIIDAGVADGRVEPALLPMYTDERTRERQLPAHYVGNVG